jgi:hypothetical protein
MQAVKVRPAFLIVGAGFAIENAGVNRKGCEGCGDGREGGSPVTPVTAPQVQAGVILAGDHAPAVMFEFVN